MQEASGKTSHLSRADRAVLSAIDGKTSLGEVQKKFDKLAGPKFDALIQQLDKDGFIREVSSGAQAPAAAPRAAAPAAKAPPPPKADDGDEGLDFTQALKLPPKAPAAPAAPKPPPQDLAAASRADAERRAKEKEALDYRGRQEAEARAKAEAEQKARAAAEARARADAEAKARAAAEEKAKAESEARARAEAEARTHAEAEAKVKAAREAAIRMATEAKAKAEAEARLKTESADRERQAAEDRARREAEDKARLEADFNAKLDAERKAREDAERRAAEAADRARKELEEKAKREADELRQRLEAEMKAKLEEERRARDEEDRKRREEEDRRRKEEDERRAKAEAERRAKEEAERKQREEEDRKRREEEDRRRKEEAERRAKEEAERKAKEEAERKAKEEAERKAKEEAERKAKEEAERKAKEEAERKAREDADRKRREEEDRRRREEDERRAKDDAERKAREAEERRKREDEDRKRRAEDEERRAREERERKAKEEAEAKARAAASASLPAMEATAPPPPPPAAASDGGIGDSLLADLDSFTQREDEERKAKEEAERQAKEAAARKAKEAAERQAKEEAEKKRREEEDRRRKEEEERRAHEEEERRARDEEEQRKTEEAERKRKAKEALAAKQTEERRAKAAAARGGKDGKDGDDIGVSDDDLDMEEVKGDHKVLAARAAKIAQEQPAVAVATARPRKLGKPVAIALFAILIAGLGLLHVVPMSTADYEKAASEAFGAPVRIGSARLSVIAGVEVKFEGVSIGEAVKIRQVRGFPEIGSLFGARKSFSRIELEGLAISQSQVADAVLGKVAGENFRVGRVTVKQLTLEGPLKLPPLDVDAAISGDGSLQSLKLSGADKLVVQLSPKGSDIGFEISAGSLALPFVPALTLNEFGMKGTANRGGVTSSEFDGRAFDGVISGTARMRWGASWTVEGEVRARGVKVAVFAPALASEGKVEGRAAYTMNSSAPGSLYEGARMQGEFKIEQGVLGSFDLTRALQTGGAQASGRTVFSELTGQGVYDKGAVQLRNVAIAAGAMNAGASLDIDPSGGLSGRIAAEVKTPNQTLRATLNVSGKVQDPVIRK